MKRFKQTRRASLVYVSMLMTLLWPATARAQDWPPAPALAPPAEETPGRLPASVRAERVGAGRWRCTFSYRPLNLARSVALAGTFNGWNAAATPMQTTAEGTWSTSVELPSGVHEYKFVVDGQRWFADPRNEEGVNDNHNGTNSVLRLGAVAQMRESAARVGDGAIDALGLEHQPTRPLYFQRLPNDQALVRLQTLSHDVQSVSVVLRGGATADLYTVNEGPVFALWEGVVPLPAQAGDSSEYVFVLKDGELRARSPETYGVPVSNADVFETPEWATHAIWYQIFLDRFRNGNPANDRAPVRPWTSEWFTPSPWEGQDGQTFYKFFVFDRQYGGDIDGLEEKLPYLKALGVNALYLNPIFKSESNHKYNAESYLHVDDHFGTKGDYAAVAAQEDLNDPNTWQWTETDRRFLAFLKTAHAQGFKVIIDGVFNHVGTAHPAFQDVRKNGPQSKYADWFNVTSWDPFKYEGWFGHDALPVFKKSKDGLASEQVRQHIFNVTRRWLAPDGQPENGIDGWRLDVPNEIPAPFWVAWRKVVKETKPDAYITGEIWDRAEAWLDGRHFDAVMNYEFARAAVAWVFDRKLKITASEIDRRLRELRLAYPQPATLVLQNLMDSHDTDRVASMALNPDRKYDDKNRVQDNGPQFNNAKPTAKEYAKARLTALLQMTYVGAPMIYYGDEAGMWGADDPTCRKPMLWEDLEPYEKPDENFVMKEHLAYYRQITALRNAHPALRTGTFQTLLTEDATDVWAFLRKDAREQLIVVLNASDVDREVTVPLPLSAPNSWTLIFNGAVLADRALAGAHATEGSAAPLVARDHKLLLRVPALAGVVVGAAPPK